VLEDFHAPINLYSEDCQKRLDDLIENFDLIFLDNLSTLSMSDINIDENHCSAWPKIGNWLRNWKQKGKTIVVVHHANKSGGSRGSSIISVEMMTQIKLSPIEIKEPQIDIHSNVAYEKHREIVGKWKMPFELILSQNNWKAIN
jgi:putative DNA primase/helicase